MMTHRKHTLTKFIQTHSLTKGAEIGVWKGETSSYILQHTDCFLYLIDAWQPLQGYNKPHWDHKKNKTQTIKNIQPYNNYKILEGISWDMAQHIDNNELDFVFIDGDHSTEGVRKDIEAYTPKVKQGGYCMGHDWDWDTVRTAVKEQTNDVQTLPNGIWYYTVRHSDRHL
tara:strand:+ start:464 stop:973 length:510 start_codon:yes stop_codon:yes gene_type:complete